MQFCRLSSSQRSPAFCCPVLWKLIVFLVWLAHSLHRSRVWFNGLLQIYSHSFVSLIRKFICGFVRCEKKRRPLHIRNEWCKCPVALSTPTTRQEGLRTKRWLISRSSIEFNLRSIQSEIYCRGERENLCFVELLLSSTRRREKIKKKCFA